jgi:cobyrinic acid a,c-diamide synthase
MHAAGDRVTGHEFHRTAVEFAEEQPAAWAFAGPGQVARRDGAVKRGVHAGYLHTHPAAHPEAITRFVTTAATTKLGG